MPKEITKEQLRVLAAVCDRSCVKDATVWERRSELWSHPNIDPQFLKAGGEVTRMYKRFVARSLCKLRDVGLLDLTRTHVRATKLGSDINDKAKRQRKLWDY